MTMTSIIHSRMPSGIVVLDARVRAARMVWDGRETPAAMRYLRNCTHYDPLTHTSVMFTKEAGYHSGGWWKNPDYERCYHLSLSHVVYEGGFPEHLPLDMTMARKWVEAFFGDDAKLTWHEGPFSPEGKARDVHHYRLFCDPGWQPIKPRGEVYSRDWTPDGWQSFSDIHADAGAQEFPPSS